MARSAKLAQPVQQGGPGGHEPVGGQCVQHLSPDARIGQLIVAAVTPKSDDATRELVRRLVTQNLVGGLIYENSTIAEQAEVTNLAQSLAAVPLMITIDGEWGLGMRFKEVPNFPAQPHPGCSG